MPKFLILQRNTARKRNNEEPKGIELATFMASFLKLRTDKWLNVKRRQLLSEED